MQKVVRAAVGVLAAISLVLLSTAAPAQQGRQRGQALRWDPNTVQTVKGTVTAEKAMGRLDVVVMVLKTDTETILVALGPKQGLDPALIDLPASTAIEVTGSRVKPKDREMILASKVIVNAKTYILRNADGQLLGKDGQPLRRQQ
jgi:hypothetical protein